MSQDLMAEELALEALFESRLEAISTRLQALTQATQQLFADTMTLSNNLQPKYRRVYVIEDFMMRLQGKPGLSNQYLENGSQPRRSGVAIPSFGQQEIDDIKMGVKTLRRKFQAAGVAVTTVGWWRHLKGNKQEQGDGQEGQPFSPSILNKVQPPLSIDTVSSTTTTTSTTAGAPSSPLPPAPEDEQEQPASREATPSPTPKTPTAFKMAVSPKELLSPVSPTTKKRNTLPALQQIFSPGSSSSSTKPHYLSSPIVIVPANPALGLNSPPMSPTNNLDESHQGNSLMRGLSLRS
ncbi:hypothetical protein BGZ83_007284 [Gryganskiella cystojenkinii]|nr:hypothetical protein BGZ83_007284 [Gryganskiella cystojenkinii]